jgi:hypothetical protein
LEKAANGIRASWFLDALGPENSEGGVIGVRSIGSIDDGEQITVKFYSLFYLPDLVGGFSSILIGGN